ncbi:hypothetical protein ALC62_00245 [Cyphomyrmex costatus]|uniref:Uncharacterized protein n=1 Tax=Cyphomyrmex costatus TaxID=456900 RepID=A0A195D8N0_9HYME|nr:hypothetical protein ALC62_00245 [Cyphomyrmex costatus]
MATMLKPSTEYNQRAAIIEGLRAGRTATEIIRFFGYPRSIVYEVVAKFTSKERPAVVEKAQALILDNPGQSLRKLASIVGASGPKSGRPYVFQQEGAPAHTSHLIQNWLSMSIRFGPRNSGLLTTHRFKSFGLLRTERS